MRHSSKDTTSNLFNRYVWLLDTIYHAGKISFDDINARWIRSRLNETGGSMPLRTFHNHRKAIEQMFDINIECEKRGNYLYYIENAEDIETNETRLWLLGTLTLNNMLNESHKLKKRIILEHVPSCQKHLTYILDAMRDNLCIRLTYHSYSNDSYTTTINPYFVKVFKQRWYVIGKNDDKGKIRTYSLDRIEKLDITDEKFVMPEDFVPKEYFKYCYGIEHQDIPQRVVLKVSPYQSNYIRALPLHPSQKEEETTNTHSIFSYYLCPHTYDFKQAVIMFMSEVEVLEPTSLRDDIHETLRSMLAKYESHN